MDFYIYYKIKSYQKKDFKKKILNLQKQISKLHNVKCSLNIKVDDVGLYSTFMEIYYNTSKDFINFIENEINKNNLDKKIVGSRKLEIFFQVKNNL
tara:strand:- start:779 stop:1066 length:288 start_codon:yes stop_codon:yes gene_type:complete